MIDPNAQDPEDDSADPNEESAAQEAKERDSKPYLTRIKEAQTAFADWDRISDNIDKKYAGLKKLADTGSDREFAIFWANMEILKPAIYTRPPKAAVDVRHHNRNELYLKTAEVQERALDYDIDADDLHDTLLLVRDDLATNGRGVPWVLDSGACIHVDRKDFVHEPARKWQEVGWVARRAWVTKAAGVKRFGEDFNEVQTDYVKDEDGDDDGYKGEKKAAVWEFWDKDKGEVVWVAEGYDETLDVSDPMIDVKGFFPCPRPAYSTLQRSTLIPVPDFVYYRDQVDEINELTARMSSLSESLRLKGFYAAGASEIGAAIETAMKATDNKAILVPVSNLAALGQGGLKDSVVWLPVDMVAQVITELLGLRKQLIDDVYQITGLSDIMRGATNPNETLGAQDLKVQFGSIRIRERQGEMARIARDILRLKAEIMAEGMPIGELLQMAQVQDVPSVQQVMQQWRGQVIQMRQQAAQQFQAAAAQAQQQGHPPPQMQQPPMPPEPDFSKIPTIEGIEQLLRSEKLRPFILDVETDSTIQLDEQSEKQSRMEFVQMIGGFMQQSMQIVQAQPKAVPFIGEVMKFAAGGFRAGRPLSSAIDQFVEQIEHVAEQAASAPQQGDPSKAAQAQYYQAKAQQAGMSARKDMQDMQIAQEEHQAHMAETGAKVQKIRADTGATIVKSSGMGQ